MTTATDMLSQYIAAETAVLKGVSVRIGNRQLTLANLPEIQQGRREWERRVNTEARNAAGGSSVRYQTPDFSQ